MKKTFLAAALLSAFSSVALANQAGDILVRGGVTLVNPDSDKSTVVVPALGGATPLTISVDDNAQLGLNLVYFFDSNWAVEVLAATPFTHDVTIHDPQGISEGLFGANVDGATLGEVTHLPPTVSALYYFDVEGPFKPYVGAGLNYTIFFDEDFKKTPQDLGFNDLELDGSFGLSAQIGADYHIDEKWHINASVRYIDIDTTANFKIGATTTGSADVAVDPMVYSIMLGYKF